MERIEVSKEQIDSLAEKLDSFERGLTDEERQVLAAVFAVAAKAMCEERGAEVTGFVAPIPIPTPVSELRAIPLPIAFRNIFQSQSQPVELTPIQLP